MARNRGLCDLGCGRPRATTACGYRLCVPCVATIRAIATDAGVPIDEGLLGGQLRRLNKRLLTRAERKLDRAQEQRAIAAARNGGAV